MDRNAETEEVVWVGSCVAVFDIFAVVVVLFNALQCVVPVSRNWYESTKARGFKRCRCPSQVKYLDDQRKLAA